MAKRRHLGSTAGHNLTNETGDIKTEYDAHQARDY